MLIGDQRKTRSGGVRKKEKSEEDNQPFIFYELVYKMILYVISVFQLQLRLMMITALGLFTC